MSAVYWPGGIPREIKHHSKADLSQDELREEVKGWLLFVEESWSFQDRASGNDLNYPPEALEHVSDTQQPCETRHVISIAPVDESHPVNRARWVKLAILFYRYDIESGHCLPFDNVLPTAAVLNPETTSTYSVEDFLPWYCFENAYSPSILMERTGTVIYRPHERYFLIVDEEGLKTGRFAVVDFNSDGTVKDSVPLRPFNMYHFANDVFLHGRAGVQEIRERPGGHGHQNQPMDMDLPIVDILVSVAEPNGPPAPQTISCDREQFTKDIEFYAPGYLALEAAGKGGEYDLSRLTEPDDIPFDRKPSYQRMMADLMAGGRPLFEDIFGLELSIGF
ncbi:uncharacterized protein N7498_007562 [Penicillium cinerascens]|uniref:Uncharacterized protein n=1 Tax=Penicillium cinerascens TaxID=70096 RepID=A0A9W9MDH6_9EURO|nr:uncharacterized protein N7498_007562 [Penicillium cinerascens]KAJ5198445.1 hypothetical protein N7498_007562 [Penicillium cinerascens]